VTWATVYTDASFVPATGAAAYAVWAKTDVGKQEHAGHCPDQITSPPLAEFFSIYAGIYHALRWWPQLVGVHIVNDCKLAVESFSYAAWLDRTDLHGKTHEDVDDPRDRLVVRAYGLLAGRNVRIVTRWVKGHRVDGRRGWVNDRVDRLAYKKATGRKRKTR